MALNKDSMAAFVMAQMDGTSVPDGTAAGAQAYRETLIKALCAGIIQEITTNGVVHTTGSASAQTGAIT
jgi:hypothetical protein